MYKFCIIGLLICFNFALGQVQLGLPSNTIDFNPKFWLDSSQFNKYLLYPAKPFNYFTATSNKDSAISSFIDSFLFPDQPFPGQQINTILIGKKYYKWGKLYKSESLFLNGQMRSLAHFNNGVKDGLYLRYFQNGKVEIIETYHPGFHEDDDYMRFSENGQILNYTIFYPETKSYKCIENFLGTSIISRVDSCSSIWDKMGSRACLTKFYYENGGVRSEFYINDGNIVHPCKEYYPNGQVKDEGHCIMSPWFLTGKFKGYYEDGKLRSIYNYKNAKDYTECTIKDGEWIDYDKNGKIITYEVWKNGVKIK